MIIAILLAVAISMFSVGFALYEMAMFAKETITDILRKTIWK